MDADDRRLLYRTEYDLLTLERRQSLLERVGEENGMTLLGFRRYERWGVYTYTAMFSSDGEVYVFVPGDDVTLGWSGEYGEIDPTTRSNIRMDLEERGCRDPEEIIRRLMTQERRVRIPPMLVQMSAVPFEGTYAKAVEALGGSLPTSDEWEYLCGGGTTTLFPWGNRFDSDIVARMFPEDGPSMEGRPNFFGLTIGTDPFHPEIVMSDRPLFRGGDFGGNILTGYGPVMGHLPVCPHFKPVTYHPDGKVPSSFLIRRIIRLDTHGERPTKTELPEQEEDPDLSEERCISVSKAFLDKEPIGVAKDLVKDYTIILSLDGQEVFRTSVRNNYQRLNIVKIPSVRADEALIRIESTNGSPSAKVFEIRIY